VSTNPPSVDPKALRAALLRLHRELLQAQVIEVERATGRSMTPNGVLQAALEDPRFNWLRDLSGLAADLDAEIAESRSDGRSADPTQAIERAVQLIAPPHAEEAFGALYLRSLQLYPAVVMAHRDLLALITQE